MADISTQKEGEAEQVVGDMTTYAAAAMLWVSAVLTVLQGVSAIVNDEFVVVSTNYVYKFNTSTWGWIPRRCRRTARCRRFRPVLDATWARVGDIVIASVSIVSMLMSLPHTPFGRS